jgi:hypothetical protein
MNGGLVMRVIRALASARLFVYCSAWLVVLVVVGTLAQASIGLYAAQERYFSSWWMLAGPVPLPGGRLTLTIVFVNLLMMFLKPETWTVRHLGLKITHLGALLLLVGGFLTAYYSSESNMVIPEGETARYVSDYRRLELAVVDERDPAYDDVVAFGEGWFRAGARLRDEALPVEIEVQEFHRNCRAVRRDVPMDEPYRGLAQRFTLRAEPANPDGEQRGGLQVRVTGAGPAGDGIYLLLEHLSEDPRIDTEAGPRTLVLRRARTYLPFQLELIDFEKQLHPGTQMARSYQSEVNLIEGGTERRVVIKMNEPLRHGGWTFYQASYIEGRDSDTTVLAAVKNYGRLFPYISSLIMCLGLLVHLVSHVPALVRAPRKEGAR